MDTAESYNEAAKIVAPSTASGDTSGRPSDAFRPRPNIKTYKIRYFLLLLFILLSASNSFQWIEYAIIDSYIVDYYTTTTFWVNCTSTVYMVLYIIGIIPATWMLDNYGLRSCLILAGFGNAAGSLIKCFSLTRNRWFVSMLGQTISAAAQLFILNIPPLLAATWFPSDEVTRTTAYGVFGNQLGIALGFFIPPKLMPKAAVNETDLTPNDRKLIANDTEAGLRILFYGGAIVTTAVVILIVLFFRDKPKYPPSDAQAYANEIRMASQTDSHSSIKNLMMDSNFLLLFISYGLNTGVFYAISTVLSQLVNSAFGSNQYTEDAGQMGMEITIAGIFGSIICGYILGYSKKFKLVTLAVYLCSLIGTISFMFGLEFRSILSLHIISAFLGFFMTGYLPIGFEFAAEVSYPEPEGTSAGLLNASAQIFGIIFTFGSSAIISTYSDLQANLFYVGALIIGSLLTLMVKNDLKRQHAQHAIINDSASV